MTCNNEYLKNYTVTKTKLVISDAKTVIAGAQP